MIGVKPESIVSQVDCWKNTELNFNRSTRSAMQSALVCANTDRYCNTYTDSNECNDDVWAYVYSWSAK